MSIAILLPRELQNAMKNRNKRLKQANQYKAELQKLPKTSKKLSRVFSKQTAKPTKST